MSTDLSTTQTRQVDEFTLVLVSRPIYVIELVELVVTLLLLFELFLQRVSGAN